VAEYDSVIPAGGSGTLTATVKTVKGQDQRFSKSITVATDAAEARTLYLRFTVETYSPISVRPSFRVSLTTFEGSPARSRVLLHRADGQALEIAEAVVEHPHLSVRVMPVSGNQGQPTEDGKDSELWNPEAARRLPIDAAPGDVWIELATQQFPKSGNTAGEIRLKTNDPEAPEFDLPYMVLVRPLIEIRPKAVRMWLSSARDREGRSAIVSLRHNGGREFTVTGIETSHPEIFTAAANSSASAAYQRVRIGVTEGLVAESIAGSVEGWVTVATNDAACPRVEIPVVVSPTRALTRRSVPTRPAVSP